MPKKVSAFTINYIRDGIEEYKKNAIEAIDSLKEYVNRTNPSNLSNFMITYNKWLDEVLNEVNKMYGTLTRIDKERFTVKDYGTNKVFTLVTGELKIEPGKEQNLFYVTIRTPSRWWEISQLRKEVKFRNINQYITFEDAK